MGATSSKSDYSDIQRNVLNSLTQFYQTVANNNSALVNTTQKLKIQGLSACGGGDINIDVTQTSTGNIDMSQISNQVSSQNVEDQLTNALTKAVEQNQDVTNELGAISLTGSTVESENVIENIRNISANVVQTTYQTAVSQIATNQELDILDLSTLCNAGNAGGNININGNQLSTQYVLSAQMATNATNAMANFIADNSLESNNSNNQKVINKGINSLVETLGGIWQTIMIIIILPLVIIAVLIVASIFGPKGKKKKAAGEGGGAGGGGLSLESLTSSLTGGAAAPGGSFAALPTGGLSSALLGGGGGSPKAAAPAPAPQAAAAPVSGGGFFSSLTSTANALQPFLQSYMKKK